MQFFVTCPKGLEDLLLQEVVASGATVPKQTVAGVSFSGELEEAYSLILNSRIANRVLLVLAESEINSADELYALAQEIPWAEHFSAEQTLAIDFNGTSRCIKNSQFGALRIKDAIVDFWRNKTGARPNVDKISPAYRINAHLNKGKVTIALDLVGASLHERGYRVGQGVAPLKENLAAAILMRMNWQAIAEEGGTLLDPMCGSGTLLTEGALIAADIPPGIYRKHWSFLAWKQHDHSLWAQKHTAAIDQKNANLQKTLPTIIGFDKHPPVLRSANANTASAELESVIKISHGTLDQLRCDDNWKAGLIVTNPPYGERLGEVEALKDTYLKLSQNTKAFFPHWQLGVFTGNPILAQHMRMRASKRNKLFNGALACELLHYHILPAEQATLRQGQATEERPVLVKMTSGAEMVANRLRKNKKALAPWLKTANTDCYRLYDADMPEYAAALDIYAGRLHLQEYAPPKKVDKNGAKKRLNELVSAVCHVFDVAPDDITIKTRERNKGAKQYEKFTPQSRDFQVSEGKAKLWVNLTKYLDTGLFLDHRALRLRIANEVTGKRFLNLFCYTATASVHAALAGAAKTVSVDMSKTYLDWASRNFDANHIKPASNDLVHSDVFKYLDHCREGFDMIMLDPPSFSNSKRMDNVLDIQDDHVALIKRCMDVLLPGGTLYFSNNLRTFTLDYEALNRFNIEDITQDTIDKDFARNTKIHQCYKITASK